MPAMTCALVEKRQTIADPRRQSENLKHPLVDVIMLGFCGVLAGCEDFVELATWGHLNEAFLRTFLELPQGIPSHDTCTRVFAMLKPTPLQEVWLSWLLARRGLPGDWIHLDGKTLRRTRCQSQKLKALHVVSAWAGQTGLTRGQVAVDAKSHEITAMPQLLKLLTYRKIVTTDALGCQRRLRRRSSQGRDYLYGQRQSAHLACRDPSGLAATPPARSSRRYTTRPDPGGRNSARCGVPARAYLAAAQGALWLGVLRSSWSPGWSG
jgi:hypothetical protein